MYMLSPKNFTAFLIFFLLLFSSQGYSQTPKSSLAPQSVETTMQSMLSAIQTNSYSDFIAAGDQAFQEGMTKEMLSSISQSLASRLKQGYTVTFLTKLNQQGFEVYVWKLEFNDRHDDVLQFMALKNGKVGGFWLR